MTKTESDLSVGESHDEEKEISKIRDLEIFKKETLESNTTKYKLNLSLILQAMQAKTEITFSYGWWLFLKIQRKPLGSCHIQQSSQGCSNTAKHLFFQVTLQKSPEILLLNLEDEIS